jgi:nucleotide-binding universal stress UspA family protein
VTHTTAYSRHPFQRVLVVLDGTTGLGRAFAHAIDLTRTFDGTLHALGVQGRLPAYAATIGEVDDVKRAKDRLFGKLEASVHERAEAAGINVVVDVRAGPVVEVITRYAEAHAIDVIVIGYRSHIFGDYVLGSTADRVAHHAPCPVLIVS